MKEGEGEEAQIAANNNESQAIDGVTSLLSVICKGSFIRRRHFLKPLYPRTLEAGDSILGSFVSF